MDTKQLATYFDRHLVLFYQNRSWLANDDRLPLSSTFGIDMNVFDARDEVIMNEAKHHSDHSPF